MAVKLMRIVLSLLFIILNYFNRERILGLVVPIIMLLVYDIGTVLRVFIHTSITQMLSSLLDRLSQSITLLYNRIQKVFCGVCLGSHLSTSHLFNHSSNLQCASSLVAKRSPHMLNGERIGLDAEL